MPDEWVDFKVIKEAINMQMVLNHYRVSDLKHVGSELRGRCPIHRGSAKSKHLSVNLSKNAFKCFFSECGAHGNILDFVAAMEKCSIREAALKIKDWFQVGETAILSEEQPNNADRTIELWRGIYSDLNGALYEVVTLATSAEDSELLVVYRELFGEYRFWVASLENFSSPTESGKAAFTLVKEI